MSLKIGDSVKVLAGVKEPDNEYFEMGDWQGRITEIDTVSNKENNTLITLEWDSLTLKLLPADYIIQSEIEGLGWEQMNLYETDVEKTVSRDNKHDVKKMQDLLSDKYYWYSFGEEGIRISNVMEGVNAKDGGKCFDRWFDYLKKGLSFPVKAIVSENAEDIGPVRNGEQVIIKSLSKIVDMYGILVDVKLNRSKYVFPLCDLEVLDKKSKDYQLMNDYNIWFSNRN